MCRQEVSSVVFRGFNGFRQEFVSFKDQIDLQFIVKSQLKRFRSSQVKFFGISTTRCAGSTSIVKLEQLAAELKEENVEFRQEFIVQESCDEERGSKGARGAVKVGVGANGLEYRGDSV
ncbi:unnamed protein product [Caenorhabditis brenneri]